MPRVLSRQRYEDEDEDDEPTRDFDEDTSTPGVDGDDDIDDENEDNDIDDEGNDDNEDNDIDNDIDNEDVREEREIVKGIVENEVGDGDTPDDEKVITISSNLRRTITNEATPYREDDNAEIKEIMCSVNIKNESCRNSTFRLHPLIQAYDETDKVWTEKPQDDDIRCYHCCHTFTTGVIRIPHSVNDAGVYTVHPAPFCSLSCAKAHLIEHSVENSIQLRLLHRVARDVYNWKSDMLPIAPARICLSVFGGSMSIKEFRSTSVTARARNPPFVPLRVMTEHTPLLTPENPSDTPPSMADCLGDAEQMQPMDMSSNGAVWDIHNLRRPTRPVVLPQERTGTMSLLEHFVECNQSGQTWNAENHTTGTPVTSHTPSMQEVNRAQEGNATRVLPQTPSCLATAPEEKRRRSRRRKYGADTNSNPPSSGAFDLSAFFEEET